MVDVDMARELFASLPDEVLEFVRDRSKGDRIQVDYDSKRTEGALYMEGTIEDVEVSKNGDVRVRIIRDDNQTLVIKEDGHLYSVGSHYPDNGPVVDMRCV